MSLKKLTTLDGAGASSLKRKQVCDKCGQQICATTSECRRERGEAGVGLSCIERERDRDKQLAAAAAEGQAAVSSA